MKSNKLLDSLIAATIENTNQRKRQIPLDKLKQQLGQISAPKDFESCLQGKRIKLIAEIKRASPSKGLLNPDLDIVNMVQCYMQGGATAISVLTEPKFFLGGFADLGTVRKNTMLPILCKDFIRDAYQVYEARVHEADAVLLIASILEQPELNALVALAHNLGMSVLVEVHDENDIEKAISAGARLIGINNRDLTDFSVDLETTLKLIHLIPDHVTVVSESGIQSTADVARLEKARVNAVLVGESLVTSPNPAAKIKELLKTVPK